MKILVCGGRDFNDKERLDGYLQSVIDEQNEKVAIIQGGARGADALAKAFAVRHGIPCIEILPNWVFYGKRAGHLRNYYMLEYCEPNFIIAFPGGAGTANMIKQASEDFGLEVRYG
jgi:predicted Rossmann-fold nucleotide-binding protein